MDVIRIVIKYEGWGDVFDNIILPFLIIGLTGIIISKFHCKIKEDTIMKHFYLLFIFNLS